MDAFPQKYLLNGSDYFQLLLDRSGKKTDAGNIARLVLHLDNVPNVEAIQRKLQHPYFKWLNDLQLDTGWFFQAPKWKRIADGGAPQLHVDDLTGAEPLEDLSQFKLPNDQLINFGLYLLKGQQAAFTITWHHALMDSKGVELAARYISGQLDEEQFTHFLPKPGHKMRVLEQLNHAREVKNFLVSGERQPVAALPVQNTSRKGYYSIDFSKEETQYIEKDRAKKFVRFGRSPFLLASSVRGFHQLLQKKKVEAQRFWVPVPQDRRRKGAFGPVMTNQVSFLFYELFPQHLESLKTCSDAISQQMMEQMRSGIPKSYEAMMDLFRWMPMPLYSYLVKGPTNGAIGSFFFSDTGYSLKGFEQFQDCAITDAIHYPPFAPRPGMTMIYMTFRDRLRLMLAYDKSVLGKGDLQLLEGGIRGNLVG